MSRGCIAWICLGPPCNSWSLARRGPATSSWGPLRSAAYIMGLPSLCPKDQAKVQLGNRLMRVSARIIRRCVLLGIPTILENPSGSRLFEAPPIRHLRAHPCCSELTLDQCQFQARWRKRTRLVLWRCGHHFPELEKGCSGRKGKCSASARNHVVLTGRDPGSGRLRTAVAQTYPIQLAKAMALCLTRAHDSRRVSAALSRGT